MLRKIKNSLYFYVAHYFRLFAAIQLKIWNPRIIVITGSNGKTTTLHLLEGQLQKVAKYSHFANSTFGIPFNILDLKRKSFSRFEWISLLLAAPFKAFKKPFKEEIYIVEADCERPGEGSFLSSFLRPEIVIWLSSARTHSYNFDKSVQKGKFSTVDEAIAHEFGYFLENTSKLVVYNADNNLIKKQLYRSKTQNFPLSKKKQLQDYRVSLKGASFVINHKTYNFPFLLPEETFYSIAASLEVVHQLHIAANIIFSNTVLPPGRSSILRGIKRTTIIDSSYNANLDSVSAIFSMVSKLNGDVKWLVLGDLIEQGNEEQEEHEKLAELITKASFQKIILVGPRLHKYTLPRLKKILRDENTTISFIETKEALDYILTSLDGGEILVFKGARYLEGIIEYLLANKNDVDKLCRREEYFQTKRKQWAL